MGSLVIFGFGQSARAFVQRVGANYSSIVATVRDGASAQPMHGWLYQPRCAAGSSAQDK